MSITIKGRIYDHPPRWSSWDFCAKAGWVSSKGVSYPEACSLLRGRRRPKPKSPPPEQVYAELEKRKLA
jgi:hypothetical protein